MNVQAKRLLILSTALLTGSLTGCSGHLGIPKLNAGIPVPIDGIVLNANEEIVLNAVTAKRRQYFCNNGTVLRCDRTGLKLYCSCPGIQR